MYQIKRILSTLEHHELLKLREEVKKGDFDIQAEIKKRIKMREKEHSKYCTTCSNELDPYNTNNYTMLFGPEDFKKKASFCGIDCLEYFMTHIKHLKKGDAREPEI